MTEQEKREKVIKGLECCKIPFTKCYNGGCPYFENDGCKARLKSDALALLKAQEPVKPNEIWHGNVLIHYQCPSCTSVLCAIDKYCSQCGRPVKWE